MDEDTSSTVPSNNEPPVRRPLQQPEPSSEPDMRPRFQPPTPTEKPKKQRSKAKVILTVLLVLALAGAGALGYMWYTADQAVSSANKDKELLSKENNTLKEQIAMDAGQRKADAEAPKSINDLVLVYDEIRKNSRDVTEADQASIEKALKDEFKLSALPEETAILAIYKVVKPDTEPSGDEYGLVYWPATDGEPARFESVVKAKDSTDWKYDERL